MSRQQDYHGQTATLVPATLRGYRSWSAYRDSENSSKFKLIGQYLHTWYPGQPMIAICGLSKDHEAPGDNCTCGVYAKYSPVSASWGRVAGIIEASGKITLGTRGFKAAKAEIVALYFTSNNVSTSLGVAEVAAYYGVPSFKSEQEALEAFPVQDLSALGIEVDTSDERDVALKALATRITYLENNSFYKEYSQNPSERTSSFDKMQKYAKFEYDSGNQYPCTCKSCNDELAVRFEETRAMTRDEEWRLRLLQRAIANPNGSIYRSEPPVWITGFTPPASISDYEVVSCGQIIREEQELLPSNPISRFQKAIVELLNNYYSSLLDSSLGQIDYSMIEARLTLKLQAPTSFISSVGGA